jgi:hypothetical protein
MKIQLFCLFAVILSSKAFAATRFSDTAAASANQKIVYRLELRKVSDLNFGEASPGDPAKEIKAGISENAENASFEVSGEPYRAYQIILPSSNSIKMIHGGGGLNREILIKEFTSWPIRTGVLNAQGESMIYVGATRQGIFRSQIAGDYTGQFFVTVVY